MEFRSNQRQLKNDQAMKRGFPNTRMLPMHPNSYNLHVGQTCMLLNCSCTSHGYNRHYSPNHHLHSATELSRRGYIRRRIVLAERYQPDWRSQLLSYKLPQYIQQLLLTWHLSPVMDECSDSWPSRPSFRHRCFLLSKVGSL